jgi:hypothetical protein
LAKSLKRKKGTFKLRKPWENPEINLRKSWENIRNGKP